MSSARRYDNGDALVKVNDLKMYFDVDKKFSVAMPSCSRRWMEFHSR